MAAKATLPATPINVQKVYRRLERWRNAGKPSACRGEYWETAWSSSVLLVSASERPTLATTARSSHAGLPKGHETSAS